MVYSIPRKLRPLILGRLLTPSLQLRVNEANKLPTLVALLVQQAALGGTGGKTIVFTLTCGMVDYLARVIAPSLRPATCGHRLGTG